MSINFATLQGLTIPEGVVTQIADATGNVLWKLETNKPVILEVEKITSDTYAGETTYTGEQFILLDIYPKTNGTVNVTYGGLTKTITDTSGAAEPNAQQVFFGTFNGVSDSEATPASGTLTIEGDYYAFGASSFTVSSKALEPTYCGCFTAVSDMGNVKKLPDGAFSNSTKLKGVIIPNTVKSIGGWAVYEKSGVFYGCTGLTSITIPSSVVEISNCVFAECTNLNSVIFEDSNGWYVVDTILSMDYTRVDLDVSNPSDNAEFFKTTYKYWFWRKQ